MLPSPLLGGITFHLFNSLSLKGKQTVLCQITDKYVFQYRLHRGYTYPSLYKNYI